MSTIDNIRSIQEDFKKDNLAIGDYSKRTFIFIMNRLSELTTGLNKPQIVFKSIGSYGGDSRISENGDLWLYYIIKGIEWGYDKVILNNYKVVKYDGDCSKQIDKLLEILELIDVEFLRKLIKLSRLIKNINYILDEDAERKRDLKKNGYTYKDIQNKLSKSTLSKINNIDKLHSKLLLNYSTEDIILLLEKLYTTWEITNFTEDKRNSIEGCFSNNEIPELPISKERKLISFPDSSRGSLCSEFLVVKNFDAIVAEEDVVIKLQNTRKDSKIKEYEYLDTNHEGFIAVKNKENNKIEFLADIHDVEDAYDCLFSSNKLIYKGWFNKRVKYIK